MNNKLGFKLDPQLHKALEWYEEILEEQAGIPFTTTDLVKKLLWIALESEGWRDE